MKENKTRWRIRNWAWLRDFPHSSSPPVLTPYDLAIAGTRTAVHTSLVSHTHTQAYVKFTAITANDEISKTSK